MIRRSPKLLVLCGGAVIACALDNRALNGVDSPCVETNQCMDGAGAGGRANSAGSAGRAGSGALGGASSGAGGTNATAGGPAAGDAGQQQVGPANKCPDLDKNTVLDCTETLVSNPGFDADIKGWTAEASSAVSFESLDAWGSNTSGSVRVENRGAATGPDTGLVYSGLNQCVKIHSDHAYVIFAQMYARGSTVNAYASVVGRVFASTDCTGTPLHVETSPIQGTVNVWLTLQATVPAVTSAGSLMVELSVGKPTSVSGPSVLNFDNVLVR
jgi:hypothetical protein